MKEIKKEKHFGQPTKSLGPQTVKGVDHLVSQ